MSEEKLRIKDLPPTPQNMSEEEKKQQDERVTRAMFKILARMPIQEIIKAKKDERNKKGH